MRVLRARRSARRSPSVWWRCESVERYALAEKAEEGIEKALRGSGSG